MCPTLNANLTIENYLLVKNWFVLKLFKRSSAHTWINMSPVWHLLIGRIFGAEYLHEQCRNIATWIHKCRFSFEETLLKISSEKRDWFCTAISSLNIFSSIRMACLCHHFVRGAIVMVFGAPWPHWKVFVFSSAVCFISQGAWFLLMWKQFAFMLYMNWSDDGLKIDIDIQ